MTMADNPRRITDGDPKRAKKEYIVLPAVQFLVALEREVEPLAFRFKEKAMCLKLNALYVGDISDVDRYEYGATLEKTKR